MRRIITLDYAVLRGPRLEIFKTFPKKQSAIRGPFSLARHDKGLFTVIAINVWHVSNEVDN
jgi:hypothetical protein